MRRFIFVVFVGLSLAVPVRALGQQASPPSATVATTPVVVPTTPVQSQSTDVTTTPTTAEQTPKPLNTPPSLKQKKTGIGTSFFVTGLNASPTLPNYLTQSGHALGLTTKFKDNSRVSVVLGFIRNGFGPGTTETNTTTNGSGAYVVHSEYVKGNTARGGVEINMVNSNRGKVFFATGGEFTLAKVTNTYDVHNTPKFQYDLPPQTIDTTVAEALTFGGGFQVNVISHLAFNVGFDVTHSFTPLVHNRQTIYFGFGVR